MEDYMEKIGKKIRFHGLFLNQTSFNSNHGFIIKYVFEDLDKNRIVWYSTKNIKFVRNERYPMSGIVKKQEIDFFTKIPTTTIKNAKVEKM